jgi:hypothetical protein
MKISELKALMIKVKNHIENHQLLNHYNNFFNILNQNLQNNQRIPPQPLDPHRNNLFTGLSAFNFDELPYGQLRIAETYKLRELLGKSAVQYIEDILRDDKFDPAGVIQKITNHKNRLNEFFQKSSAFVQYLEPFTEDRDIKIEKNEGILQIHFTNKASINNIVDFEKWIDTWQKILRNFSLSTDRKPEEVRVIYVQKSSPLLIEVAAIIGIINLIGGATLLVLNNIDKYLEIQKKIREIKKMDYLSKKQDILDKFQKEADDFKEISSEKIAKDVLKQASKSEADHNEIYIGLKMSISDLFKFIDCGGRVETYNPNEKKDKEAKLENTETKKLFDQIRKLQQEVEKMRFIEHVEEEV